MRLLKINFYTIFIISAYVVLNLSRNYKRKILLKTLGSSCENCVTIFTFCKSWRGNEWGCFCMREWNGANCTLSASVKDVKLVSHAHGFWVSVLVLIYGHVALDYVQLPDIFLIFTHFAFRCANTLMLYLDEFF